MIVELSFAVALFMAGRFVLAAGARAVRGLRRFYDRAGNRQPHQLRGQVKGLGVHTHSATAKEARHHG